jgi:hypothetical protein
MHKNTHSQARRLVTLKLAMRQLLEGLRDCHATGIVHRRACYVAGGGSARV